MKTTHRIIGLALCLAAIPALAGAGVDREIYPPNPDIYMSINNLDGIRDGFDASPAGKLWAEPTLDPVKESAKQAFQDLIDMATAKNKGPAAVGEPVQVDRDMVRLKAVANALCQGLEDLKDLSAAIYIAPATPGQALEETRGDIYIAATLEGETLHGLKEAFTAGVAENLPFPWDELDKEIARELEKGEGSKVEKLDDETLLITNPDPNTPTIAISGNRIFIGTANKGDSNDWVRQLAKGKPAKSWIDPAKKKYGGKADDPRAVVLAKTEAVWEIVDAVLEQVKQTSAEKYSKAIMIKEAVERAGLADIKSFAAKWTAGEEGFRTRAEIETSDEPRGFLNLGENAPFEIGEWVPEGTVSAFESQGRPLSDMYGEFRSALEEIAGIGALSAVDSAFEQARAQTGIDVHKDVLLNLGGHLIGWETSTSLAGPLQLPPVMLAWEVNDAPAMLDVIQRLTAMTPPNLALMTQDHEFNSVPFKTVGVATLPFFMPAYGAIDGMIVVSSSANGFEMTVKTREEGGNAEVGKKIKDAFKDAGLPFKGVSMRYSDIGDSVQQIPTQCAQIGGFLPIWMMLVSSKTNQNPEAQQAMQSAMTSVAKILQSLAAVDGAKLASHLNPAVSVMYVDGGKIVSERLSSIPDEALAIAGVGAAGAAMVGVTRVRKVPVGEVHSRQRTTRHEVRNIIPEPGQEPSSQPRRPSPSLKTQTADLTVGKSKTVGDITIRVESVVLGANEKKVVLTVAGKDGEPETRTLAENEAMHFGGIEIAPEAILAGDEGRGRAKLKISRSTSRPERGNR